MKYEKTINTLLAFAITRYAGAVYGITKGLIYDSKYRQMIKHEVKTGLRKNSSNRTEAFLNAFFHLPEEIQCEIETAGFICEKILGIVGPAWLDPKIDSAWNDPEKRECMMEMARLMENEPVISPRILAVGKKTG